VQQAGQTATSALLHFLIMLETAAFKSDTAMMERVSIPTATLAEISRHLSSTYPCEGCGVLLCLSNSLEIVQAISVKNIAEPAVRDRYEMDPLGYATAEKRAAECGLKISGFFHSHPNSPPVPSQIDLDAARGLFEFAREEYIYLIQTISASGAGKLKCWRFDGDNFTELAWAQTLPGSERPVP
jgi:proteasome lid subunit RPN8/RPN11